MRFRCAVSWSRYFWLAAGYSSIFIVQKLKHYGWISWQQSELAYYYSERILLSFIKLFPVSPLPDHPCSVVGYCSAAAPLSSRLTWSLSF